MEKGEGWEERKGRYTRLSWWEDNGKRESFLRLQQQASRATDYAASHGLSRMVLVSFLVGTVILLHCWDGFTPP